MPDLARTGQHFFTNSTPRRQAAKARANNRHFAPLRLHAFALKVGMVIFLDGQFVPDSQAVISVCDRGFLLGDGLFETMRVVHGKPFRFEQHLQRLARGADFLKIKLPFTAPELETFAGRLVEWNQMPEAVLRLTLTRGPGGRGYTPDRNAKPTIVMTLYPLPPLANPLEWRLITSKFRVPADDPLAAFKTTSKILHVMARAEAAEQGVDEALLLNTNGEVAETTSGNLFWIQGGKVCTVPAKRGVLPGVTRAVVLAICKTLKLKTIECAARPAELKRCQGIFVTQSVFAVVPIASWDGQVVSASPLASQIAQAYQRRLDHP